MNTIHKNVLSYDDAYECQDCGAKWGAITNGNDKPPPKCLTITTNNTEVIITLEKRVEELEKNAKKALKFLDTINEEDCSYYTRYYLSFAKEHLQIEESKNG